MTDPSLPPNVQGGIRQPNGDWLLPQYQANPSGGIYYSPTRRLYYMLQNGKPNWISPLAFDSTDRRGLGEDQSFLQHRGQWNQDSGQVEHPLDMGNILSAVAAALIAQPALGGGYGGTTAATAGPASTTGAGTSLAGIEGGAFGMNDAALAALGTGPMATKAVSGIGAGVKDAWDASGNFIGKSTVNDVTKTASPVLDVIKKLAGIAGIAVPSYLATRTNSPDPTMTSRPPTSPLSPELQSLYEQLLKTQVDRVNRTTPLHQAAMAMASRMAPGYAQSAMTPPSSNGTADAFKYMADQADPAKPY